jgi:galactokinase/mevalonate kinase-like predicted kinase
VAGVVRKKVNWVLDADIRGFFDAIDHGWLTKFVEHRIADRRVLRLIQKWLTAGVIIGRCPQVARLVFVRARRRPHELHRAPLGAVLAVPGTPWSSARERT